MCYLSLVWIDAWLVINQAKPHSSYTGEEGSGERKERREEEWEGMGTVVKGRREERKRS